MGASLDRLLIPLSRAHPVTPASGALRHIEELFRRVACLPITDLDLPLSTLVAKVSKTAKQELSTHDIAQSLFSARMWELVTAGTSHFDIEVASTSETMLWRTMAQEFGLQHVRAMSVLSTIRRFQNQEDYEGDLVGNAKQVAQELYEEFNSPPQQASLSTFITSCLKLKDSLLVSAQAHNLFSVAPGSPYNPSDMHATNIEVPSGDEDKYSIVLTVWPGLVRLTEWNISEGAAPGGDWVAELVEGREWVQGHAMAWGELGKRGDVEVAGRAEVVVQRAGNRVSWSI
jgi:hypothetical protein